LKVAIVGCGKIADAHVEEIAKVPSVQLAAVCDLEPFMAEQLAVRYGVKKWYSDVATMLRDERPEVLHITTPPQSHLTLVRQAVASGAHVFLEKPVAPHHVEVVKIVETVRGAGKKLAVNYWPQFESQAFELRDLVARGVLGDPVHIESYVGYDLAGDFGTAIKQDPNHWVRRMPGQLFQNMLDHVINKIVPFLDTDTPQIEAFAFNRSGHHSEADLLDELRVVIRGKQVTAYATFCAHARPVANTLRVYGTRNTAHVDYNARTCVLERKQPFPSAVGRLIPPFQMSRQYFKQGLKNLGRFRRAQFHFFDGMRTLLTDFYRSIETGGPSPTSDREILTVSGITQCIFEQVYPTVGEQTSMKERATV
jgi:predicted dehydrogenase